MFKKLSLTTIAALCASGAFAANTYYVAHEPKSMACTVTTEKPNGHTMMQVGGSHRTRSFAEPAMKTSHQCGH